MKSIRPYLAAGVIVMWVHAEVASSQQTAPARSTTIRPFVEGALAGLALGFSFMSPRNEAWLLSDESAFALATATGIATALAVEMMSRDLAPDAPRRPRLRVAMGRGTGSQLDHAFALRLPGTSRLDKQIALVIANDTWEKVVFEERCVMYLGCFEDHWLDDLRNEQSLGLLISGVVRLNTRHASGPTLALGAGPAVTHVERLDFTKSNRGGALAELTLGIESGGRGRWIADVGVRAISSAEHRVAAHARIGRAFGY